MQPLLNIKPFLQTFGNPCEINGISGFAVVTAIAAEDALYARSQHKSLYKITIARADFNKVNEKDLVVFADKTYRVAMPASYKLDSIELTCSEVI